MAERALAAVVLAAGKGTRMKSDLPKVLHPVLGVPMLAHPLNSLAQLEVCPCVVVVGFGAEQVQAALQDHRAQPRFVVQAEQLGTGHATLQARSSLESFSGDVLILPGDAPLIRAETLRALVGAHRLAGADLSVLTTRLPDADQYGRIVRAEDGTVQAIVEARDCTLEQREITEINSGIYVVDSSLLFPALARVGKSNAQGEYYLTDVVAIAAAEGRRLGAFCHPDHGELAGINDRVQLAAGEVALRSRINAHWMRQGVTLEDPASIRIEGGVVLEQDVALGAGVQLRGICRVARGCRIDAGAVLTDVHLGTGSHVGPYSVLEGIELGPQSRVPPLTQRVAMGRR